MKYGSSNSCYCGSGLKYKDCCIGKIPQETDLPIQTILLWARTGLENFDLLVKAGKKVIVKDLGILNENTIECKFYSYSANSIDIKTEIGLVMGFLYGFFQVDGYQNLKIQYYAVRAYDKNDIEILNALSFWSTAKLIGQGNSIDWLKSTQFIENTNDYRLGVAKKVISEIENSLRHVVKDILEKKYGTDWWDKANDNKLGQSIKTTYFEQFGDKTSNGEILIDYTYLHQIKKIVLTHWPLFKHLFQDKGDFERALDRLNLIRREEAHNRNITPDNLTGLEEIYNILLPIIATEYDNLLPVFLIDNWRARIKSIMGRKHQSIYQLEDIETEMDLKLKLAKVILNSINLISYLEDMIQKLESVVVPVQKKILHEELLQQFKTLCFLEKNKLEQMQNQEFEEAVNTAQRIQKHESEMKTFSHKFLLSEA